MLEKIVSGGQTGVDQAALRVAKSLNIPTGGWAPKGWQTEDGPLPSLADYGLKECSISGYPPRTRKNIEDSDGTLIIIANSKLGRGTKLTLDLVHEIDKWFFVANLNYRKMDPVLVRDWLYYCKIRVLNVAGSRESKCLGIGDKAEAFLLEVLKQ